MIRILVVDDSTVAILLLKNIFESETDMEVIATASNGKQALELVEQLQPDIVIMDIYMPVMDGIEATRKIMSQFPVPIIVVSCASQNTPNYSPLFATESGALWIIEKPPGFGHPDYESIRLELINTVRAMTGMKLIKRRHIASNQEQKKRTEYSSTSASSFDSLPCEIIALGSSTGGPQAMLQIFSKLPADFQVPIVVVQHISKGFTEGLVEWLQANTLIDIKIAEHGEVLQKGTIYFAKENFHLVVQRRNHQLTAQLLQSPAIKLFRPSATPLFESIAITCPGKAIGVVLTGMGDDGAEGLKLMRSAGCQTIVQDKSSSIVYGMPDAALQIDAVGKVVALSNIAQFLIESTQQTITS